MGVQAEDQFFKKVTRDWLIEVYKTPKNNPYAETMEALIKNLTWYLAIAFSGLNNSEMVEICIEICPELDPDDPTHRAIIDASIYLTIKQYD